MKHTWRWRAAAPLLLAGLAWSLSGCSLPGTINSSAAPSPGTKKAAGPLTSATGQWVFTNSYTFERLRLHQQRGGVVTGGGASTVSNTKGQKGHFAINIHRGYLSKGALTLTLYIQRTDANSGRIVAEYLTCKATTRVLRCRMDLPMLQVHNVAQNFYRRA